MAGSDTVHKAIDQWERDGLIDADTAASLRVDTAQRGKAFTRRLSQYLLAIAGGVALLIAGGLFLDWAWPQLGDGTRALVLIGGGGAVIAGGVQLELRRLWLPAGYLIQTSGIGLILFGLVYSERSWDDLTAMGILMGVIALVIPVVLAIRALRRGGAVMPAVILASSFAFLAIFLDRVTPLSGDSIIWCLDGFLAVALLGAGRLVLRDPAGSRFPWAMNSLITGLLAGFVLVAATAWEVLDLTDDPIYALDAWLALVVSLTLWGIHKGPPELDRPSLGAFLATMTLFWMPLGYATAYELGGVEAWWALLLVGGAGVAGFAYADSRDYALMMMTSVLLFITAIWFWAVDRGGALGAVAAFVITAGILFWLSGRAGSKPDTGAEAPPADAETG